MWKPNCAEYARAGIAEYWIVDPTLSLITVLSLSDGAYIVHGEFQKGDQAVSRLLPGFAVDVATVLAPKAVRPPSPGRTG